MSLFEVQSAALLEAAPGIVPAEQLTPAQRRGLKYQAKVEAVLEALYPGRVLLRPWFRYKSEWQVRRCQPDVVLFDSSWEHVLIVEVKSSTIPGAWSQLKDLYAPVVAKAYRLPISLAMIVPMFDPHVAMPCRVTQLEGLDRLDGWKEDGLGVVSWKR